MKTSDFNCAIVTFKCNWNCEYCVGRMDKYRNFEQKSDDEILEIVLEKIKGKSNLVISGGEPGLMSTYFYDNLFHNAPSGLRFVLNTNGLWFKRGYYEKYKKFISFVNYHCVQNLKDKIEFYDYIKKNDNIIPMIVVYSKNIYQVRDFLLRYKDITVKIDLSLNKLNNEMDLSINDLKILLKELKDLENYNIDMINLIKVMSSKVITNNCPVMLNRERDLIKN